MAETQIQKVSVKHDAIMDYMIANPTAPMSAVAEQFKIGAAWLSVIIHSDAFQAQLEVKKDGVFNSTVVPLREKLIGVAHLGLDRLGEALEHTSPHSADGKEFIADTTDSILANLGYSPKSAPTPSAPTQNNTFIMQADKGMLADARDAMRVVKEVQEGVTIEHTKDITSDEV